MKALLALLLTAPAAATTFTPCPRSIDAPPIRLAIINTQTPGLECAKRAADPLSALVLTAAAACAHHQTITVQEYHINNAAQKCGGKTACADVQPDGCVIFVNSTQATERDYGAAVRKCWEGRV